MRYIGDKFLSGFINAYLLFNVLLQFIIGCFQFSYGFLQLFRKSIHTISQYTDLILGVSCITSVKIQLWHPLRQSCKRENRRSNLFPCKIHDNASCCQGNKTDIYHETVRQIYAFMDTCNRHGHDKDSLIIFKEAPVLQIEAFGMFVKTFFNGVIFFMHQCFCLWSTLSKDILLHTVC